MNLPLDIESYLKKIFPSYDLNGIFFMFYKHNWNILNKSQVYSSPKMFFLSLATCDQLWIAKRVRVLDQLSLPK